MNNTGKNGKSGREKHTMAAKPGVSTQIKVESRKEIPSWAPTIRDTHTQLDLNEYKREGRHAT